MAQENRGPATEVRPPVKQEMLRLAVIAGPLIAAYLAEFAMALTTKAIIGRLGYRELASVGLATDAALISQIAASAMLTVVGVLVAQADGAGRKRDGGNAARQGFIVATLLGLPLTVLFLYLDSILALTGQDPALIAIMGPYLNTLAGSVLPFLWFFVLRTFVTSLAKTGAILVITLMAVVLNYVACVGLVEGRFSLPEMGVAGAGLAKTISTSFMFLALLSYTFFTKTFRGYGLFISRLRLDPVVCGEIVRLGIPVAGISLLEGSLFAAVSIFSGQLGSVQLATYQVMIAWLGIAFMCARGLAEAGMVRVANGIGRGSLASARRAGLLAIAMGVGLLTVLAIVPLKFPVTLVGMFLDPSKDGFFEVLALAKQLLILAAFFQVFDGLQVIAALALRGMKDTIVPLWMAGIGYWGFGIAGGWILAFPLGMGAYGLWLGMAAGLTITGTALAVRFALLTRYKR